MKWFSLSGIATEVKRIRWPKPKEVFKDCMVVLIFIVIFGAFFFAFDLIASGFLNMIGS